MNQTLPSVKTVIREWYENKPLINAYLAGESIEGIEGEAAAKILGFGIGIFILVALVVVVLWFWALYATIKFWNLLPAWARVVSVIGLLTGWMYGVGTLITLIVVYASKRSAPRLSW